MAEQFNIPGLKDAIAEITKLNEATDKLSKDLLASAINGEKLAKSFGGNQALKDYIELQKKANETEKETKAIKDKLLEAQKKLETAQGSLAKEIATVTLATQKANAENKAYAKANDESRTSLEKFNAKILESTRVSKELGAEMALMALDGKKNTIEYRNLEIAFQKAAATSKELNDSYRDISKTAGDNRALVGSYSTELKGHFDMINGSITSLKSNIASGNFSGAFNDARTIVQGFGEAFKRTTTTSKEFGGEMKSNGSIVGSFKAKATEAGNATLNFLKPSTENTTKLKEGLERVKIGFTQNAEAINKVRNSQNEANGVAANANSISEKGGVLSNLYSRAQILLSGSTGIASASFNILKVAIASTGIGLIIIGVGLLVNGLSALDSVMDGLGQVTAGFSAGLAKASSIVVNFTEDITSVGDAFSKIGDLILHPIDSIKSFSSEVTKTASAVMKLKEAEQDLGDLKNIYETRSKNIESQIKLDEIKLKNKHLSAKDEQDIETRITANYAKMTKMRDEINEKTSTGALELAKETQIGKTKINQQVLENEIKTGELVYANFLLNANKINQATFDKLQEAANMKIDTNNKAAEDEERTMAKVQKASDRVDAQAEKSAAAAEKNVEKQLASQKKTADEAVKTMKITLDNQIATYDQESKLESENLAHVQTISLMKVSIANAELSKNLIGVKKGSQDEISIKNATAQELIKIENEKTKAIEKIQKDGVSFEMELYDFNNKTLIEDGAELTDLLVNEEKKRIAQTLDTHRNGLRKILEIDENLSDEKLKEMSKTTGLLTAIQLKYLQGLRKLESDKDKDIKKLDADSLAYQVKNINTEVKNEEGKFKLLNKNALLQANNSFKLKQAALKKELTLEQTTAKRKLEIAQELASNQKAMDQMIADNKKQLQEQSLNVLIDLLGKESVVGKAAAIAQIGISTYESASKAFTIAGLETVKAAASTAALDVRGAAMHSGAAILANIQGGIIIAGGAIQAGKIAGFEVGTNDAPYTGQAIVDEKGAEIHTDAFGKIKSFGSDGGAHLTDIVKGDKIIPADISAIIRQTMFSSYGMNAQQQQAIDYAEMGRYFDKSASKIVNAVNANGKNQLSVVVQRNNLDRVTFRGKKV